MKHFKALCYNKNCEYIICMHSYVFLSFLTACYIPYIIIYHGSLYHDMNVAYTQLIF